MTNNIWYDNFLDMLYKKCPKKNQLVEELVDLLLIEREAVYRRLRQDVMFSANEVIKIASAWNISLDKFVNNDKISFLMHPINYFQPSEDDFEYLKGTVKMLQQLKNSTEPSEYMEVCNRIPRPLNTGFAYIYKFYMFKWAYQYGAEHETIPYSKVEMTEDMLNVASEYYAAIRNVTTTNYVFDYNVFKYFLRDVQYFHSINLITDEEKELIKNDLRALLDDLMAIAVNGYFPTTQNTVNIYISRINIDTNYSYFDSENLKVFRIHTFNKYEIKTYEDDLVIKFKNWTQLNKRSAVQISAVDEKSRIDFFNKQHHLIDMA